MSSNSSIINLKAEFIRKKQEAIKRSNEQCVNIKGGEKWKALAKQLELEGRVKELKKKRDIVTDKKEKDEIEAEIERALILSRLSLEKKAKLYDSKMAMALQGIFDSDEEEKNEDERCLVNFDEKAIEHLKKIKEKRSRAQFDDDEDEWVEYTDVFNRNRKCLKKDLPHLINADLDISKDLHNTLKPEEKYDFEKECNNGPVHYETIRHNEVREHGVGYYRFSADSEERKRQMEELNELRKETERQTRIKNQIKKKKQALINERLSKIAAKRGLKLGNDTSLNESDNEESLSDKMFHSMDTSILNKECENSKVKDLQISSNINIIYQINENKELQSNHVK